MAKQKESWFERQLRKRTERFEALTWPQVATSLVWVICFSALLMTALIVLARPMELEVDCEFTDWTDVPENTTFIMGGNDFLLYPGYSKCHMDLKASGFDIAKMIVGLSYD